MQRMLDALNVYTSYGSRKQMLKQSHFWELLCPSILPFSKEPFLFWHYCIHWCTFFLYSAPPRYLFRGIPSPILAIKTSFQMLVKRLPCTNSVCHYNQCPPKLWTCARVAACTQCTQVVRRAHVNFPSKNGFSTCRLKYRWVLVKCCTKDLNKLEGTLSTTCLS